MDKPVETVDEYDLWLCIGFIYEDEYSFQPISSDASGSERSGGTRRCLYAYQLYTVTGILHVMPKTGGA